MNHQQWRSLPPMSDNQWHEWRRSGIGASDAPVIMGVSPWTTPLQLFEKKVFNTASVDNIAMKYGRDNEEKARKEFEQKMNTILFKPNIENIKTSWLHASLDGIDPENKIMVEIKCPNKDDHQQAINKKIPEKYYPQCQHQLAVTGLPGMYYFSFDGSNGVVVEVSRDQKYIDEMLDKETEFWNKVLNQTPPDMTDKDVIDMEKNMEHNKQWKFLCQKWKETNERLKDLQNEENVIREQLIALSKNRNAKGNNISVSKSVCKGNIDYSQAHKEYLDKMRVHYPDIPFPEIATEPYRKKSFIKWTIRAI